MVVRYHHTASPPHRMVEWTLVMTAHDTHIMERVRTSVGRERREAVLDAAIQVIVARGFDAHLVGSFSVLCRFAARFRQFLRLHVGQDADAGAGDLTVQGLLLQRQVVPIKGRGAGGRAESGVPCCSSGSAAASVAVPCGAPPMAP